MRDTEKKHLSSKCRELLKQYSDVFEYIYAEIKRETEGELSGGVEDIALEYKNRQGIRQGARLFITKINSKADERE